MRAAKKPEPKAPLRAQPPYLHTPELLGSLSPEEFERLKQRVVASNKAIGYWQQQNGDDVIRMTMGHVSVRVPGTNTFVSKGRPPERDFMAETRMETLVQIDIPTRQKVAGELGVAMMGEVELHAALYEKRPDVVAVAHVNGSDWIQLCGLFKLKLKAFGVEGMELVDDYGLYDKPYMLSDKEPAASMARALGKRKVVLCAGHGACAVSTKGPEDAVMSIFYLDQLCKMNWLAFSAVGRGYQKYAIQDDVLRKNLALTKKMHERRATPGKDRTVDQINACAALARTVEAPSG